MERVLVTGADGFVASHLIAELYSAGAESILGIGLKESASRCAPCLTYCAVNLLDREGLREVIGSFRPDSVFHLAAQPSVAASWENPFKTYEVNVLGELNLFEVLRELGLAPSVHVACSSEEYGKVRPDEMPLVESSPLKPCSHYAVSKVTQEYLALMYHEAFSWRVLVTRGFNQAGPGQSDDFVVSSFARQLVEIESGMAPPVLKVGNLDAERDFTDVRDTARAYRMVMEKGKTGSVYNVCSGVPRKISDVLKKLLELTDVSVKVERDPLRERPSDIPVIVGDNRLIREELGWEPEIPFERTLEDTLNHWREKVVLTEGPCS